MLAFASHWLLPMWPNIPIGTSQTNRFDMHLLEVKKQPALQVNLTIYTWYGGHLCGPSTRRQNTANYRISLPKIDRQAKNRSPDHQK